MEPTLSAGRRLRGCRRLLVIALALLSMAGALALWNLQLEDRWATKRWGVVEQGRIYRSGRLPRDRMAQVLAAHGIRVIVDLTEPGPANPRQRQEQAVAAALGIDYCNFPLCGDGTGDIEQYALAVDRLARARRDGQPVLVHCAAGAQRTGGVVAAYRLLVERAPVATVLAEMERYGWHPVKDRILTDYLHRHMAELAARLQALGTIPAIPDPLPSFPVSAP